jgi:hypothetical protein
MRILEKPASVNIARRIAKDEFHRVALGPAKKALAARRASPAFKRKSRR